MKRRFLPRVSCCNFRKKYPNLGNCFTEWLSIRRFWSGRIINIYVKHYMVSLDFRANWISDMRYPAA